MTTIRKDQVKNIAVTTSDTQTLTNKTLTSPVINTPTGIVKGDVGLGNVDNTSDATKNSATATLTNKTLTQEDWHLIGASGEPAFENSWVNYGFESDALVGTSAENWAVFSWKVDAEL